jgi:hypothetical protein
MCVSAPLPSIGTETMPPKSVDSDAGPTARIRGVSEKRGVYLAWTSSSSA